MYIFIHCQNTFQWNISFTVKIHLLLVFTTCKKNGEDQLIIVPSDLTLTGKKLFLLAHYAVSGVIFCVNECSAPEGSQTDRALYSSLLFKLYTAQGTPSKLPFLRPALKQWKANPCVRVVFLLLHGFFFPRVLLESICQIIALWNGRKSNPFFFLWKLIPGCSISTVLFY